MSTTLACDTALRCYSSRGAQRHTIAGRVGVFASINVICGLVFRALRAWPAPTRRLMRHDGRTIT